MTKLLRGLSLVVLLLSPFVPLRQSAGQQWVPGSASTGVESRLPSAPVPQLAAQTEHSMAGGGMPDMPSANRRSTTLREAGKYDPLIEPGESGPHLSRFDKLAYSARQVVRPITLIPALYSTGYEQLFNTDPKYGVDAGAGAAKFGAAILRGSTTRTLSDGVFAAAFRQDPRYYRVANGSIVSRGLLAAERAFVRRSDDGVDQVNFSGLTGRAAAAALTLAYYPAPSRTASVVLRTFGWSIATNAGGNLVFEFFPDLVRKFPSMAKVELP